MFVGMDFVSLASLISEERFREKRILPGNVRIRITVNIKSKNLIKESEPDD